MKFDISAKIVPPTQRAWVVHAGRSRVNYKDFVENEIVFLEIPYIKLDKETLTSRASLRRTIRRAIAWRDHKETTGSNEPSAQLKDYEDGTFSDDSLQTLSGSINRLYGTAKVGDLVIVPGREIYEGFSRSVVRIGEIITDFNPEETYSGGRASTQSVPIRRVRWLSVMPRREVSTVLERKIGKPPAVREIKIEKDTEDLLKYAYELYIYDGNSSSLITGDRYDGRDFVLLNKSSDIIAFLVSAHAALLKEGNATLNIDDIDSFSHRYFSDASIDNIEVAFASPGHWRIIGATVSLAAFVSLGIAVFTSGMSATELMGGVEVTNSIAPDDTTAQNLESSMNLLLKSFDKAALQKTLDEANQAKEAIGLKSSTKKIK